MSLCTLRWHKAKGLLPYANCNREELEREAAEFSVAQDRVAERKAKREALQQLSEKRHLR